MKWEKSKEVERNVVSIEPDLDHLPNIKEAIQILKDAKLENKTIMVHGDSDCDGICGTAILIKALKDCEIQTYTMISNRLTDGYGFNLGAVEEAEHMIDIGVIVTVDCGISDYDAVKAARTSERDLKVIVTDHHELPGDLPPANVIVHPGVNSELQVNLSGSGVALLLSRALREEMIGDKFWDADALTLAAIATIADHSSMEFENRWIVKEGLANLIKTEHRGLTSLLAHCDLLGRKRLWEDDLQRFIALINACGRMGTQMVAYRLLMADSREEADSVVNLCEGFRKQRVIKEKEMMEEAIPMARECVDNGDQVIVIHGPDFHKGIVGLVAMRLLELFGKPTIVFCGKGDKIHGSGRSHAGWNLYESLKTMPRYSESFGGHSRAIGMSIFKNNFEALKNSVRGLEVTENEITYNREMNFDHIDPAFTMILETLKPFGNGNPQPVFVTRNVDVLSSHQFGPNRFKAIVQHGGKMMNAIGTKRMGSGVPSDMVDLSYTIPLSYDNLANPVLINILDWRDPIQE